MRRFFHEICSFGGHCSCSRSGRPSDVRTKFDVQFCTDDESGAHVIRLAGRDDESNAEEVDNAKYEKEPDAGEFDESRAQINLTFEFDRGFCNERLGSIYRSLFIYEGVVSVDDSYSKSTQQGNEGPSREARCWPARVATGGRPWRK